LNVVSGAKSTRGNAERIAASREASETKPNPIQPRRPKKSRRDHSVALLGACEEAPCYIDVSVRHD
jgi:hypothetical protein